MNVSPPSSPPKTDDIMEVYEDYIPVPHTYTPAYKITAIAGKEDAGTRPASATATDRTTSTISKFLKGKEREWDALSQRKGPLTLLELPVDILRLIVKEITHTNDLTSLALTNSTLHNLAVPHIYARFDIVWPDAHMTSSDTKSVDALTYGLSTLCLGSSFARTAQRRFGNTPRPGRQLSKFVGNEYAKYTRKFSLGNGPNDWVAEYMITKESGKMLGTLVALAVAKMVNLETFVWDMPTGVLSDIFMALSSLPEQHSSQECKLERLWIRWHDNNESPASSSSSSPSPISQPTAVVPLGSTLTPIGISLPASATHPAPQPAIPYSESVVEYPTFSVLPPLKSLTVLDIDELAYLDEMAVLVETSKEKLQELRVGVSSKATHKDFVQTWDGDKLQQIDHNARWPGESTIGERRLGGVLGVLVGRIYDIRRKGSGKTREPNPTQSVVSGEIHVAENSSQTPGVGQDDIGSSSTNQAETDAPSGPQASDPATISGALLSPLPSVMVDLPVAESDRLNSPSHSKSTRGIKGEGSGRKRLEGKLRLQTLELERIPLSMQVCAKAFDWTVLTNLTILECAQHENLWKLLKKQFLPTPMTAGFGISPSSSKQLQNAPLQYHLNLKHIHTDITSPPLISFIKETLAPNTLEALFLQDRRRASGPPPVSIDAIFRGALKRHRSSLRKLLLDSAAKALVTGSPPENNIRWRNWILSSEMILYITSGRMSNLRELAVSMDYRDWHTFLQRLPNVPQLRSLNIPYIADHVIGNFEPKELALQIADIITLRPEIQLCYIGISTKCFEILETPLSDKTGNGLLNGSLSDSPIDSVTGAGGLVTVEDASDDGDSVDTSDDENDDDDDDNDETEDEDEGTPTSPTDPDETQSEHSDGADSEDSFVEPDSGSKTRLRLREILFYDDKVAIFKARHGRL